MQHFRLMRVEDIGRIGGANSHPGMALMNELDRIGQEATPKEDSFRRMLKLAGYDWGMGISLDPVERAAYVDALNLLIWVWNGFERSPSLDEYEAALHAHLSIGADIQ